MGKRPGYAWTGSIPERLRFERGARTDFPNLTGRPVRRSGRGGFTYTVAIDVPFYEQRVVTIRFKNRSTTPYVRADGPDESPHRYGDNTLCMWYPRDPDDKRWVFTDGLRDLLHAIVAHLWREAWWRETGEWLGEEVPHAPHREEGVA